MKDGVSLGMEWLVVFAIFALFGCMAIMMPSDSPAQLKWFFMVSAGTLIICEASIRPKFGWAAAIFFGYCIINAAWFWIYKNNRYLPVGPYDQLAIRYFAVDGIAKLLFVLIPITIFLQDRESFRFIGSCIAAYFCMANIGLVYYSLFFQPGWCQAVNSCGGAFSNPSMNSSMIVTTLPFLIDGSRGRFRWAYIALACGAVLLSKSSIGVGLLAALTVLYAVRLHYWKLLALAPLPLIGGLFAFGKYDLLSSGDRFFMWKFFMEKWADGRQNFIFGTGYGTFGVFSSNLQKVYQVRPSSWWTWMHNDWLEILFALGVVGLILAVAVYLTGLIRYVREMEYTEATSLALFGLTMCVNYPLHHPISCLFGAWLVMTALFERPNKWVETLANLRHNC